MTKAMEEARAIAQMFDDIYVRDGFCDWADVANARDEALRLIATALAARDAEIERLREALAFYAEVSKYPAPLTGGMGALWSDCGEVARRALTAGGQP